MVQTILRRRDVEHRVGLKHAQIYNLMKRGEFPRPITLSTGPKGEVGAVGWIESEVQSWLEERIAARDGERAA